jgi:hypothetical protein
VYGASVSSIGVGVYGYADKYGVAGVSGAASGTAYGVYGEAESSDGYGMYGTNNWSSNYGYLGGNDYGVYGHNDLGTIGYIAGPSYGVFGEASPTSGVATGGYFTSNSSNGTGVFGEATSSTGNTSGVYGWSSSSTGKGVYGRVGNTAGSSYGVYGETNSVDGTGVFGEATSSTGNTSGVYGWSSSSTGKGVYGRIFSSTGTNYGVYGETNSTDGFGVWGKATATSGWLCGVFGTIASSTGFAVAGVVPSYSSSGRSYGGFFDSWADSGRGVAGYGRYAGGIFEDTNSSSYGWVGYSTYKIYGTGSVNFVQNHPRDDKLVITYSSPEGNEVATYTRGTARLENGEASIDLDETFGLVTNPDVGLTAHLTPRGDCHGLYVASLTTSEVVVRELERGTSDVEFDYIIYGLRIGFEEVSIVQEKDQESYIPSMKDHRDLYARRPDLRRFNSLERFKNMRMAKGISEPVDLSASHMLRDAIQEYDPAIHGPVGEDAIRALKDSVRNRAASQKRGELPRFEENRNLTD